ncbi:hypothetical protein BDB01DRAFT_836293 [Pilobolus umbonatus]|nr:hypothetical protein BDB01DRAFT_836293 [Pilobolus umbonatus]
MDVDVEAMLDAPYQPAKMDEPTKREDEHRSSRHSSHSDRHQSSRSESRRSSHRSRSRQSSRRYRYSRSPSRDRRHRRSPSRDYRRRTRSPRRLSRSPRRRSRSPDRYSGERSRGTSSARRGGRSPSPPLPEEDRDRRTVFVTQLAARLTTRELEEFFSQAGRLREAKLITDRNSRRSKGVGYVEFYEESSVQNALALSGQKLLGIPVLVQLSEAEKNRLAMQAQRNAMGVTVEPTYQRLYVGSLHFSLTDDDVRQIFEPFGPLDFVNLHKDPETGRSKGFGFIQYKNSEHAKQALEKMNGFELAGRNLKVGLVTEKSASSTGNNYNLDDEESEGLALNSLSRAELMAKLAARDSSVEYEAPRKMAPVLPQPIIPVTVSRYVMLNNMFNPDEETEPDWVSELESDIKLECEKFGHVEHIKVNSNSMGEVFLKFDNNHAAENAVKALNGRWFGGKQITASYVSEAIFNANSM